MEARQAYPDKWQLRHWQKGIPYGGASELSEQLIQAVRGRLLLAGRRVTGKRDLLIFDLLLHTGCYIGELYDLKMSAIAVPDEGAVLSARNSIIFSGKNSKYHTERYIPVNAELAMSIERFGDLAKEWVCWSQLKGSHERINKVHLSYMIFSWGKNAGIKLRAHSFRKAFLRRLAVSGTDIETLKRLSGYKSIQSLLPFIIPGVEGYRPKDDYYGESYQMAESILK